MYKQYLKRILDALIASVGLLLLSPFFIFTIIALFIANKGKVFFLQERPGLNEKIFKIIKFKTMNDQTDETGKLLPDNVRLTRTGAFVRKTSLDELPQLINVVKGDMSIVGPRPLRTYYLPLYQPSQKRRHNVRPGITGWAQVNGRNDISWTKKFEYDVWYVDNISFILDVKIILRTILKVLKREGVAKGGYVTTDAFNGSN